MRKIDPLSPAGGRSDVCCWRADLEGSALFALLYVCMGKDGVSLSCETQGKTAGGQDKRQWLVKRTGSRYTIDNRTRLNR